MAVQKLKNACRWKNHDLLEGLQTPRNSVPDSCPGHHQPELLKNYFLFARQPPIGAGKTAVLAEVSDILTQRQIVYAAIELDALGLAHLPSAARSDGVMYNNLRSICRNCRLGRTAILSSTRNRKRCSTKTLSRHDSVRRLTASIDSMKRRVQMRDLGISQLESVARVGELNVHA